MNQGEFESYVSRALDNDLTAEEFAKFEQHLASSPDARAHYLDAADLHNLLDLELQAKTAVQLGTSNVVDIQCIITKQKRKSIRIAAIAAAAVIIISLVSLRLFMIDEQPPTLSFNTTLETEFTLTHSKDKSETSGMTMEKGSRLQVSKGIVELTFASGVRSVIRAPADVTLHEDDKLFMKQGTAWFEVPKKAVGFTVITEDLNIVDLGTEFGVIAKPGNYDEVHVFKGKVKVDALGIRKESTVLVANEARRNNHIGRLDTIAATPYAFFKRLSDLPPYLHWSFDHNDEFAVKGNHPDAKEITTSPSPSHSPPKLTAGKYGTALTLNGKKQGLITNWIGIYGDDRPVSTAVWGRIPEGVDLTGRPAIVGWGIAMYSKAKWKVQVTHKTPNEPPVARVSIGGHFYDGKTRLDDNQWHHIAAVYHGKHPHTGDPDIALYIDGKLESLTQYAAPLKSKNLDEYEEIKNSANAKTMMIGKGLRNEGVTFRGLIDELYIFDGAISQETVKSLMTSTKNKQVE